MYRKIGLSRIITSKKLFYLIIILSVGLAGIAWGADGYVWTGNAPGSLWNTPGNWDKREVPQRNSGHVYFCDQAHSSLVTIPAGYTADCTFGDGFGTVYGPEFGMCLDIYGSLKYKWYLAAGQDNKEGARSILNMYEGSFLSGEGLAVGDNWWLPGPYVTMNMYGDAVADVNYLWVGGHLNMYGGTMDVSGGVEMSPNVDDDLTRVDIYAGKLVLPSGFSDEVNDWISRGILSAYGRTPGTEGCDIIIDTATVPGRTVLTATAGVEVSSKNESAMWERTWRAVSSIADRKYEAAEKITQQIISDYNSNDRLADALIYVADKYENSRRYSEAKAVLQKIAEQFPASVRAADVPGAVAKINVKASAKEYAWTGNALDSLWSTAGNWDKGEIPPRNSGSVSFSNTKSGSLVTIPAGFTAECTFGDEYGTIYGPSLGMCLDIYGRLNYKWYLAPGQDNPAGQRSVVNMYNGSSITGEGLAVGDNWWLPGPYTTMNMYGDAAVDVNYLWVGGHLNMYGGTLDVARGINMSVNVDDDLTLVDIHKGKLLLPADVNEAVVSGWISRGMLLAYGHVPGTEGCDITIDTVTIPGRTILTAAGETKAALADIKEQANKAASFITECNSIAAKGAIERLLADYSGNENLPEAILYIADSYAQNKEYDKAFEYYSYVIDNYTGSIWADSAAFEKAKNEIYLLIEMGDEQKALAATDELINTYKDRLGLAAVVYDFAVKIDKQNHYEPNRFTQLLLNYVIEKFPESGRVLDASMALARMEIIELIDSNDMSTAVRAIDKFIADYNSHPAAAEEMLDVSQSYYNRAMFSKYKQKLSKDFYEKDFNKSILLNKKITEGFPDTSQAAACLFRTAVVFSQELGDSEKGVEYFEKLLERYPEHENNDYTHYLLCRNYGLLKHEGKIEAAQADVKIEESLKAIIEKYPNSRWSAKAAQDLGVIKRNEGKTAEAVLQLENALQKSLSPESKISTAKAAILLGETLENSGQKDYALQVYKESIVFIEQQDPQREVIEAKIEKLEGGEEK